MMRKTSIIILTYNNLDYTKACIESILKYTDLDTYELVIVDNNSTDGTHEWLKKQDKWKIILNDKNEGFPKGCNQGIQCASENDILLLNNDTIVTENWLKNLKICLESDSLIGAVGAVCNNQENRQGVNFNFKDMEEMQQLAKLNNVSNKDKWEEKNFLIGFCLLIKREVITKLKGLDENYSPGYIEDNDLSLRIINLGYKLMLCHDAFIFHYLGTAFRKDLTKFYPILNKNREYFINKWHFNTFCFDDLKSFSLMEEYQEVLELNCGIGSTILALKYQYKNISIEGVEINQAKRNIASHFAHVYQNLSKVKKKYDCILIGNCLEQVKNPEKFLEKIKKLLKKNGCIIGRINNCNNIKNLNRLLNNNGYELLKSQVNFFSILDIERLLKVNKWRDIKYYFWYENLNKTEMELYDLLKDKYEMIRYSQIDFKGYK